MHKWKNRYIGSFASFRCSLSNLLSSSNKLLCVMTFERIFKLVSAEDMRETDNCLFVSSWIVNVVKKSSLLQFLSFLLGKIFGKEIAESLSPLCLVSPKSIWIVAVIKALKCGSLKGKVCTKRFTIKLLPLPRVTDDRCARPCSYVVTRHKNKGT